jgi:hypothetical protein
MDDRADFPLYEGGDPRLTIRDFLRAMQRFLDGLIATNADPFQRQLFSDDLYGLLREAWNESQVHFRDALARSEQLSDADMYEHGLWGAQLRLKTVLVRRYYEAYLRIGAPVLRSFIDVIDDFLKSILSAIPGGEAISEIKDAIKNSVLSPEAP